MFANESSLNEKVGQIDEILILVWEVFKGNEVEDDVEIYLWIFALEEEEIVADELHLFKEGRMTIFHCCFEFNQGQRQFVNNRILNSFDIVSWSSKICNNYKI